MKESSFWSITFPRSISIYANLVFVGLWVGFVIALVVNREWLDGLWNWAQALPPVPKITLWVVFLPIMVGLWIWESSWLALIQLMGFAGMVAWTLLAISSFYRAFR